MYIDSFIHSAYWGKPKDYSYQYLLVFEKFKDTLIEIGLHKEKVFLLIVEGNNRLLFPTIQFLDTFFKQADQQIS